MKKLDNLLNPGYGEDLDKVAKANREVHKILEKAGKEIRKIGKKYDVGIGDTPVDEDIAETFYAVYLHI